MRDCSEPTQLPSPSLTPSAKQRHAPYFPAEQPSYHRSQSPARPPPWHRRQSRFDPMMKEEDSIDEEVYGELGQRHPLRRLSEEDSKERAGSVSLPSIKALFGVAGDRPSTPSSSTLPPPLFQSTSAPTLVSPSSSSSPSTSRTSRYSSLASASDSPFAGWWGATLHAGPSSLEHAPYHINSSLAELSDDEHLDKRRRSDDPPPLRDAEESARLRHQAQSRNASYPATGSVSLAPGFAGLYPHPAPTGPPSSYTTMSRPSLSGPSGHDTPTGPHRSAAPSRNPSLVGGQLAQSFADLSAKERVSPMPEHRSMNLVPPDRRPSMFPMWAPEDAARLSSIESYRGSQSILKLQDPPVRSIRQSVTRPSTPDDAGRPVLRRSSLTEIIMAKSGDDVAIANGHFQSRSTGDLAMDRPSVSDPVSLTGWPSRPVSAESHTPATRINRQLSTEDPDVQPSSRGRKRPSTERRAAAEIDGLDQKGDPAMRGMEMLAESARRVSEDDRMVRTSEERDLSPGKMVPGGPKYSCSYCSKTFSRPSSLRIHTYSHTGERPFVCKEPSCRRRFSVQSNLKRHAKVHQLGISGTGATPHSLAPRTHVHPPVPGHMAHPPANGGPAGGVDEDWEGEEDELDEDEMEEEDE